MKEWGNYNDVALVMAKGNSPSVIGLPSPSPQGHIPPPPPTLVGGGDFLPSPPPWGIHPRRGPHPHEMAQRTDVPTSAAGATQGREVLVRSSRGWQRRRAGTGGWHTTAQRKECEAMVQHKEGEGAVP
jgi:hypothetical protein